MIVKDEEEVLERCLSSVKDAVDEIIIVDTGSSDGTVEVAKKFGAKIHSIEWQDNFASARNTSFSLCTKDFILWLDADDVLKSVDRDKLIKLKETEYPENKAYLMRYCYNHDEYDNVRLSLPRHRLIKNGAGIEWHYPIHECMIIPNNITEVKSDVEVHHYRTAKGYDRDFGGGKNRNIRILEKFVEKNPNDERFIYYLGKEYIDDGIYDKGIEILEAYLSRNLGYLNDIINAYYKLGNAYLQKEDYRNAIRVGRDAVRYNEFYAEFYYIIGQSFYNTEDWERAKIWFKLQLQIEIPISDSSLYLDNYTWIPHDRLCFIYDKLGDRKKALFHGNIALEYRPNDQRLKFNVKHLSEKQKKRPPQPVKLNLGCGNKRKEGYIGCDIFQCEAVDEIFDLRDIPYENETVSHIYCEHALEHLSFEDSEKALDEFNRVLTKGGVLELMIPDFSICVQNYIKSADKDQDWFKTKDWFKRTIFGIQKSQFGEPVEAEFHKCGYSKHEIVEVLERRNFIIDYAENYDGFGTPSVGCRCIKPVSDMKIGWISETNWEAAQTRIRVLNVDRWLRTHGYRSKIVNYPEIFRENYDVAIVGKAFDENHFKNIKYLKENGKKVYCDLCEDILQFPWVKEILEICDKVICCSHKLEEAVKKVNPNTIVIEDAFEV